MGFGLIFVGYFMASVMTLNSFGMVFSVVGYSIMAFACGKLSEYNKSFYFPLFATFPMIILSLVQTADWMWGVISYPFLSTAVGYILSVSGLALELVFVAFLCFAIKQIAIETGAEKIPYLAVRNFIFYCLSFGVQIFAAICRTKKFPALWTFYEKVGLLLFEFAIPLIVVFFFCLMLISCYRQICDAADADMAMKPSRFAFINKQREAEAKKYEAFEEKFQKYKQDREEKKKNRRKK